MAHTLYIDTAVQPLYLALEADNHVVEHVGVEVRSSDVFHVALEALLMDAGIELTDIEKLVVVRGPGSFTGLRVTYSFIEALKLVRKDIVVESVTALEALLLSYAEQVRERFKNSTEIMVLANAHGGQVFNQMFVWRGDRYEVASEITSEVLADMVFKVDVPVVLGAGVILPVRADVDFYSAVGIKHIGMNAAIKTNSYDPLYIKELAYKKVAAR